MQFAMRVGSIHQPKTVGNVANPGGEDQRQQKRDARDVKEDKHDECLRSRMSPRNQLVPRRLRSGWMEAAQRNSRTGDSKTSATFIFQDTPRTVKFSEEN
jgi:hypothetical protein